MSDHGQGLIIQIFRKLRTNNVEKEQDSGLSVGLRNYVLSNLLSVIWSVSLFVGGLIFWLYYRSIRYFPDLDLDSSILFLAVASFTGAGLTITLCVGIVFPSLLRWLVLKKAEQPVSRWSGLGDNYAQREPIWFFFSSFIVWAGVVAIFALDLSFKEVNLSAIIFCVVFLIVHVGHYYVYIVPARTECIGRPASTSPIEIWCLWLLSTLVSFLVYLMAWILFEKAPYQGSDEWILICGACLIIMSANITFDLLRSEDQRPWRYWIVPPVALWVILIFASVPLTSGATAVVRLFKWGDVKLISLAVDKRGCSILAVYQSFDLPTTLFKDRCQLRNVNMLSRLGSDYYLESQLNDNNFLRFTIPAEHVLSWSTIKDAEVIKKAKTQTRKTASN